MQQEIFAHTKTRSFWQLPAYSPDLNPIEHVWAAVKRKQRGLVFHTQDALWEAVERFYGIVADFIEALTSSMPDRIAAVKTAFGGPTRY